MRRIETSIEIEAPVEAVGAVLGAFEHYGDWNSFCPGFVSSKIIGEPVFMTVHMWPGSKPIKQREILAEYDPPRRFAWALDWGPLLRTYRLQTCTDLGAGRTRYYTYDEFRGLLTPLVLAIYGRAIQRGFENTARDLKGYVERGGKSGENRMEPGNRPNFEA